MTPTSRRARGRDDDGPRGAARNRVVGRQNPREAPRNKLSLRPHPRTCVGELASGRRGNGGFGVPEARTWRVRALILGAPSRRERAAARGTGARAAVAAATAAREKDMEKISPREPRKVPSDRTRRVALGGAEREDPVAGRSNESSAFEASARALGRVSGRRALRTVRHERTSSVQKPRGNILFLPGKWPRISALMSLTRIPKFGIFP